MKNLLAISFLTITLNGYSLVKERLPYFELISDEIDSTLEEHEAIYIFNFEGASPNNTHLIYSIDGVTLNSSVKNHSLEVRTTVGKHIFQFYWSEDYEEVYTDSLPIEAMHVSTYSIRLNRTYRMELEKPVIYLYPEVTTKVQVALDIKGSRPFMYPAYDNCWQFTARPNGDLIFGKNTYNYLFWEASTNSQIIPDDGFVVAGANTTSFMEEKLSEMGFTSKEQADFITYWAPKMSENEHNFIQFTFNEECNRYATMEITPKPDHIFRVYMLWTSVYGDFQIKEQVLEKIDRTGFTVVEWGGQESQFRRNNCLSHQNIDL